MSSPEQSGSASPLTPEQAEAILRRDAGNLIAKVKSGKPLSSAERRHLVSLSAGHTDGGPSFAANSNELAQILKVERHTINRWKKQKGAPEPRADGRLDVQAWKAFKSTRKAGIRDGNPDDPSDENRRKTQLQNEKLAVQVEILRKEWIRVDVVEAQVAQIVMQAKRVLIGLPGALAPQVSGSSVPDAERLIRDAITDALEQLHINPAALAGIKEGGEEGEDELA